MAIGLDKNCTLRTLHCKNGILELQDFKSFQGQMPPEPASSAHDSSVIQVGQSENGAVFTGYSNL